MTPVSVLEISTVPMNVNGITRFMLQAVSAMDRENMRVDYACFGEPVPAIREAIAGMGGRLFVLPHRNRRPLSYMMALRKLIRREKYGVVHVHGNSATMAVDLLGALLGGAGVRIAHCHNTMCVHTGLNHLLAPALAALATRFAACGEDAGKWLFGKRPFAVLPNGIDTARFLFDPASRAAAREALGLGDSLAVGMVAAFVPAKNHGFLLRALAECGRNDISLVLVGEGPMMAEVRALADSLGLERRVKFLGVRDDVPQILSALDLAALPSRFEGFPTVALEWQCAGLAALVSDTVTRACDVTGSLEFLPLDEAAWAAALREAGALPDGERMSRAAAGVKAARAGGYDLTGVGERLRALYGG